MKSLAFKHRLLESGRFTTAGLLALLLSVPVGLLGDAIAQNDAALSTETAGVRVGQGDDSQDEFLHSVHAGAFPTCEVCHNPRGRNPELHTVESGDCGTCHDGNTLREVNWTRTPRTSNLRFDHKAHDEKAEVVLDCTVCHQSPSGASVPQGLPLTDGDGNSQRVDTIARASLDNCSECHEQNLTNHFEPQNDCSKCHYTLVETEGPSSWVASLPQPESHQVTSFFHSHGDDPSTCQFCHSQESCERCHFNAEGVAAIQALSSDARVAELVQDLPGSWPAPSTHDDPNWWASHGRVANETPARCTNCHTKSNCVGCHEEGTSVLFAAMYDAPTKAKGLPILPLIPLDHTPEFRHHHSDMDVRGRDCSVCHAESFCIDCHRSDFPSADAVGGFHPPNFLVRHAASANSRDPGCIDCHSLEGFCRDCHQSSGIAPTRSQSGSYHDAEPLWLLDHANAARTGLDACASCHQQTDCLQCHSAKTGWSVSPHGPDFDPEKALEAGDYSCALCHLEIPGRR